MSRFNTNKIYVKFHNGSYVFEKHGVCLDLKCMEHVELKKDENKLISLGVSMKLPKWYTAYITPRSGTYNKYGVIQANHVGIIDGPDNDSTGYSGNKDIWKFNAIAMRDTTIPFGDRICQFEIRPSYFAPWYVKLMFLFKNNIGFIEVDDLKFKNRGGHGNSGR